MSMIITYLSDYTLFIGDNMKEFKIKAKRKRSHLSEKEQIIENLRWKLRFHEEQANNIRQQIKNLESDN